MESNSGTNMAADVRGAVPIARGTSSMTEEELQAYTPRVGKHKCDNCLLTFFTEAGFGYHQKQCNNVSEGDDSQV